MNLIIPIVILGLLIYYFDLKNQNNKYSERNNLTKELIAYKKEIKTNKNYNIVTIISKVILGIVIVYMSILLLMFGFVLCTFLVILANQEYTDVLMLMFKGVRYIKLVFYLYLIIFLIKSIWFQKTIWKYLTKNQ